METELIPVQQPLATFHKDEGGKANTLVFRVRLSGPVPSDVADARGDIELECRACFEDGSPLPPGIAEDMLDVRGTTENNGPKPVVNTITRLGGVAYRLNTVSKKLGERRIAIEVRLKSCPHVSPLLSEGTTVFSKRKDATTRAKKQEREKRELEIRERHALEQLKQQSSFDVNGVAMAAAAKRRRQHLEDGTTTMDEDLYEDDQSSSSGGGVGGVGGGMDTRNSSLGTGTMPGDMEHPSLRLELNRMKRRLQSLETLVEDQARLIDDLRSAAAVATAAGHGGLSSSILSSPGGVGANGLSSHTSAAAAAASTGAHLGGSGSATSGGAHGINTGSGSSNGTHNTLAAPPSNRRTLSTAWFAHPLPMGGAGTGPAAGNQLDISGINMWYGGMQHLTSGMGGPILLHSSSTGVPGALTLQRDTSSPTQPMLSPTGGDGTGPAPPPEPMRRDVSVGSLPDLPASFSRGQTQDLLGGLLRAASDGTTTITHPSMFRVPSSSSTTAAPGGAGADGFSSVMAVFGAAATAVAGGESGGSSSASS